MKYNFNIYCLVCPIDNKIKYIGLTQNVKNRVISHYNNPLKSTKKWISRLKEKELMPIVKILQTFKSDYYIDRNFAIASETIWINELKNYGLLNISIPKVENIYPAIFNKIEIETKDKINYFLTTIN